MGHATLVFLSNWSFFNFDTTYLNTLHIYKAVKQITNSYVFCSPPLLSETFFEYFFIVGGGGLKQGLLMP